jgi:arylsulfatase A-like enzyme
MKNHPNQSRRHFMKTLGGSVAALALSGIRCAPKNDIKPNIIYILADDLGYGDLGCYGQEKIKTPNLDQMAAEGIRFTQHYAGSTVCAPSRCALMTGKHGGHCTVRGNVEVLMKQDEMTLGKLIKQAGYSTGCIGKWGIGHPPPPDDPKNNGFDYFFGYLSMWHAHNYYPEFLWRDGKKIPLKNIVKRPEKHYQKDQENLTGLAIKKVDYSSDLFTQDALSFIEKQQNPFFLFLCYTIPHVNNEAVWFNGQGMEVPDYGIYKDKDWIEPEKAKAAMITRMDRDIGMIFQKLKDFGIDDNTLGIFTSDNGPHKEGGIVPEFFDSNGKLRGIKRDLYEGGVRVPMIARWSGKIKAGSVSDHVSAFWDVLPTFADLANIETPQGIDGISFLPTLLGNNSKQKKHEFLYWEFHEGGSSQAIRMGDWKAVRLAPSKPIELYNLKDDVREQNNVAEQYPEIVAKAKKILTGVRTDEDIWPLK